MRKTRRIEILKQQIEKLNDEKYEKDEKWTIQTLTYINRFFGENSPQSKYIKEFKFQGYIEYPYTKEDKEKDKIKQINEVKRFLYDCIEVIQNNGVEMKKSNFLEKFSNKELIPILVSIVGGILYVGFLFGTSTTDSKNVELRQANKELLKTNNFLIDSLTTINPTFKIPDNISK